MPGVLPLLNRQVVDYALKMALATDCTINRRNNFARKNYFYPDLPKGYQISQYAAPLAEWGAIEIETEAGKKRIGITRIHMEEDAGKLIHDEANPVSYVDFNRTGVPLIEIVSEPDLRSAEEAVLYLRAFGTSSCTWRSVMETWRRGVSDAMLTSRSVLAGKRRSVHGRSSRT